MEWQNKNNQLSILNFYKQMGFKCSYIVGNDDIKDSYKKPQEIINNIGQIWDKHTGIGVYLGNNNDYRAIDIDDFQILIRENSDSDYQKLYNLANSFFINKCMTILGLPEDYEWIIRTPHGWHIVISAPSFGFEQVSYNAKKELMPNIISGNIIHFSSIELLWKGFLVMPPSQYGNYNSYSFYNQYPKNSPIRVGAAQLLEFICTFCGEYQYITDLNTYNLIPIIGNAHLFPHYEFKCGNGSMDYENDDESNNIIKNEQFLKMCRNPLGFNMLGFYLVNNDLNKIYKVDQGLDSAIKCFRMANDGWGHYNLACLMAIGAMDGGIKEFYKHIELSIGFPNEYKEQLKILFLTKNHTYEEYAIIDISTNENNRIEKIAILIVDIKGDVLNKSFLLSDSCVLQNMYNVLVNVDYLVGCDLSEIKEIVRKECKYLGFDFSYNSVGVTSAGEEFIYHCEGYYLDAFNRPWIDLKSFMIDDTDPFRRIYKIKDKLVQELNN